MKKLVSLIIDTNLDDDFIACIIKGELNYSCEGDYLKTEIEEIEDMEDCWNGI
jgi:hypothetical protein